MMSIKEIAKKTSITPRTLRYYDSIGLLKPMRTTEGGHRMYSEEEIIKLHQIQFLKQMGFGLKDIQELLEQKDTEPLVYLNNQLQLLREQQERLQKMEHNILGLIHSYKIEGKMDWSVIFDLIQQSEQNVDKKRNLKDEMFDEHQQQLLSKLPSINHDDEYVTKLVALINQAQKVLHKDPASPEVQQIAERFTQISKTIFHGDEELIQNIWEIRKSPEKSRNMGWYPLDPELIEFLDQAFAIYDSRHSPKEGGK